MSEHLSSTSRSTRRNRWRQLGFIILGAALVVGLRWSAPALAQTASSGLQPSTGMGVTSPLGAARPAGIPLGSTEIATPGLAPVSPPQGTGVCAGSGNAGSPGALFDGGGVSGGASLSCADSRIPASALPSPSSAGRVGIPLGATELGGVGVSPTLPVPGPAISGTAGPSNNFGTP
ncbi:exported hypothetical protein [Bradyrhizobium sp. STM 3843]|uniref:hypothetical protein n=1 Tax=Bradyrhizobium sp. STM 3843 TaxID=551947 RepID=UPI000240372B|nr:hypothetical protein [Bradyrhizobium sp. STM 3843]CCE10815.1 exported hypothetical protein [Bradyrhizobium sp. STM 3843]